MNNIQRTFFVGVFSLSVSLANAQVSNADTMIHKIFATLKAKDDKAFVALYPNAVQFSGFMRSMMTQLLNSEQMKQAMAMDEKSKNMNIDSLINTEVDKLSKPEAFAAMQKKFSQSFYDAIKKGESKGVKWNEAKLTSYTIDSTAALEEMEMLKDIGFKAMKGVIDFNSAGTDYQMSFEKVMYLPAERGWFGGEFDNIVKKGESLEGSASTSPETKVDSTGVAPQQKAKTKTKTPTTKTKTKTKTAASKPGA